MEASSPRPSQIRSVILSLPFGEDVRRYLESELNTQEEKHPERTEAEVGTKGEQAYMETRDFREDAN